MNDKEPTLREIILADYAPSLKRYEGTTSGTRCIECGNLLSEDDIEIGYECEHCRRQWMADVTGDDTYL